MNLCNTTTNIIDGNKRKRRFFFKYTPIFFSIFSEGGASIRQVTCVFKNKSKTCMHLKSQASHQSKQSMKGNRDNPSL